MEHCPARQAVRERRARGQIPKTAGHGAQQPVVNVELQKNQERDASGANNASTGVSTCV